MSQACRFSVVVVNLNGGPLLSRALSSAVAAGVPAEVMFVIDNGSVDRSADDAERLHPGCHVIRNGCNLGFARAVNKGLKQITTEFALLLNNDAELEPQAIEALTAAFDCHQRAALLGGRLLHSDGRRLHSVSALPTLAAEVLPRPLRRWTPGAAAARLAERSDHGPPLAVPSVSGAALAVRMSAAADFGMLDEEFFFYFEETEWCLRAARHGWQVLYVPQARVRHAHGATARRYGALARIEYQRSKLTYFRKIGTGTYRLACAVLWSKAMINGLSHVVAAALTLGMVDSVRRKAGVWTRIWLWLLSGRPEGTGLPGKPRPRTRGVSGGGKLSH